MDNIKPLKIIMRPDYMATLLSIDYGESVKVKVSGRMYSSFLSAASRLNKLGRGPFNVVSESLDIIIISRGIDKKEGA